jgi:hypothetical protein
LDPADRSWRNFLELPIAASKISGQIQRYPNFSHQKWRDSESIMFIITLNFEYKTLHLAITGFGATFTILQKVTHQTHSNSTCFYDPSKPTLELPIPFLLVSIRWPRISQDFSLCSRSGYSCFGCRSSPFRADDGIEVNFSSFINWNHFWKLFLSIPKSFTFYIRKWESNFSS